MQKLNANSNCYNHAVNVSIMITKLDIQFIMSDNSAYSEYYTVDANENDDNPLGLGNDGTSSVKSLDGAYENVVKAAQKIDKPLSIISIIIQLIRALSIGLLFINIIAIIGVFLLYGLTPIPPVIIITTIILITYLVSYNRIANMLSDWLHNKFLSMVESSSYTCGMCAELKPCMQLELGARKDNPFNKLFSLIRASDYNTKMPSYIMKYLLATTITSSTETNDYTGRLIAIIYLIREHDKEADFNTIMPKTMQLLHDTALRLFAHDYNAIVNGPEPFTTAYNEIRTYSPYLPALSDNIINKWNNTSYSIPLDDDYNNNDRVNNPHELGLDSPGDDLKVYYTNAEYNIISDNNADTIVLANASRAFIKYFNMFVNDLQTVQAEE